MVFCCCCCSLRLTSYKGKAQYYENSVFSKETMWIQLPNKSGHFTTKAHLASGFFFLFFLFSINYWKPKGGLLTHLFSECTMGLARDYINLPIKNIVSLSCCKKKKLKKEKEKMEKLLIQTWKAEAPHRHSVKAGSFLKATERWPVLKTVLCTSHTDFNFCYLRGYFFLGF